MQVRRRILHSTKRKGLDRSVRRRHHSVDHVSGVKAFHLQIVREIVGIVGRRVTLRAARLAEEYLLSAHLGGVRLPGIELAIPAKLRRRWKIEHLLKLGHGVYLAPAVQNV